MKSLKGLIKNITIFSSVIFLNLILMNNVKAYSDKSIYIDYNSEKIINMINRYDLEEAVLLIDEEAKKYYNDYLIVVDNNYFQTTNEFLYFYIYELNDNNNLFYYQTNFLNCVNCGYSYVYLSYNSRTKDIYYQNTSNANEFYMFMASGLSSTVTINFPLDLTDNWSHLPLKSTLPLIYSDYNSNSRHLFINNGEIKDGDFIPLLYNESVKDDLIFNITESENIGEYVDVEINATSTIENYGLFYSLDGVKWNEYINPVRMYMNGYIVAKMVDSDNNVILSETYNITSLNINEPTIKVENRVDENNNQYLYVKFIDNDSTHINQFSYNGGIFQDVNSNEITINVFESGYVTFRILDHNLKLVKSFTYNYREDSLPKVNFTEYMIDNENFLKIDVTNIDVGNKCILFVNTLEKGEIGDCSTGVNQVIYDNVFTSDDSFVVQVLDSDNNIRVSYDYRVTYVTKIGDINDVIPYLNNFIDENRANLNKIKTMFQESWDYLPGYLRGFILVNLLSIYIFITIKVGGK